MTNDNTQKSVPIYNEEYLIKMLGDISQHKPITLAEAIAYQYIDIEDPKLGLSYETIQRIKNLFHPLLDESISNLIRIKRSGEYLTDINLTETNPFEKFTQNDPNIYQLQQTFEPTLDFNEKQFRSFVETILNNKDEYDQLQFDIGRTLLPLYDIKESSTNDFSQSDSGYSMTTATHESLASKIKIEFEPINQDLSESIKQVENDDEEKIDLDKATQEQLDKYELNPDLIQIIKTDFRGTDKTVGQAILSRELRLDSTDPNDISYLNSLGIHKEEARLLTNFFFPKQTRIIAYSPQPGRFVEAQTTYNPDYPGYKTDTTIIQIQEKQLSADPLAMQRSIHDDRQAQQKTETEQVTPVVSTSKIETVTPIPRVSKDNISPLPTPVYIKKRKSSTTRGLLSCFRNKKAKPGTEQQGQPTIVTTRPSIPQQQEQTTAKLTQEKPLVDYSITPDGKRIYIDVFRDRPGLDMSYRPNNFEDRYILPVAKSAAEYERPITPEIPLTETKTETETVTDEVVHTTSQSSASSIIEHKPHVHLEPRPATIEPVDVQPEPTPIVIPSTKSETTRTTIKKSPTLDLHGPAVHLPAVELVEPGLLPALPKTQIKKTTRGLCAACFGVKSSEKKRKDMATTTISSAPIEQKNVEEKRDDDQQQQEKEKLSTIIEVPSTTSASVEQPILPKVNIDVFKERNFQQSAASLPKSQDQSQTTVEKTTSVAEPHYQLPSNEPVPSAPKNISLFSQVNIDTFRERTFQKGSEGLPKSQERLNTTTEKIIPPPPSAPVEERHYQSPANEPLLVTKSPEPTTPKNTSIFSQVNIDTFRERNFQKSSEGLPKLQERSDITTEKIIPPPPSAPVEEPYYQLPTNEPLLITPAPEPTTPKDASIFSQVNIDTFRDRNFQKSSESLPKSEEPFSEKTTEQVTQSSPSPPPPEPVEEPHYQLPTNEPLLITQAPEPTTPKDASLFSQVNIDTFRERTLQKGSEKISTSPERSQTTPQQVTSSPPPTEEPHYQLPTNEPILVKKSPEPTISKDTSIFSQVNIDTFRERNFQTPPPKFEEPHYQSPSSEPVPPVTISTENEYSVPGSSNTYDIPRSTELQQTSPPSSIQTKTEENIINNETMIPSSTVDNQKSGGDYVVSQSIKEITKTERTSNIQQESPTTKKPKKKKANVLSTLFQSNGQKSTVPALNLPSIERDLSPNNNQTSPSKRHNDDPLHVPSVNLPKLDLPLPSYDRPEVDMTTGSIQQTSEFAIPVVSFPPIPNLSLPENNNNITSSINTNTNHMKIPHVELPELQLTLNNNQTSEPISMEKTIKTNEITVSPINDNTTTYTIKQETITTSETKEIGNETSQEQFTIINTHLVESKEVPVVVEKQTTSGFGFQLPSPEPILIVSKDSKIKPPSFDDDVPSAPSKIVSITIHSSEKSSNEIKKKSSTLALCSCFGNKSHHITKEKSLTIKAPKSSLPAIEMPLPSSNISSTLKPKGPLRAPTNDLPPVDLTPKATELVHLPTPTVIIQSNVVKKENDTSFPTTVEQTKNKSVSSENQPIEEIQPKQSSSPSSFEIKAPIMNIPPIDVSTPAKPEVYISHSKFEQSTSSPEQIQSRSDSGLEAIVSSHVHPSSTFNDIQQYPSVSSGFGSGTLENISADIQSPSPILIPKDNQFIDYNRHITINNEIRQKIDLYENQLKKSVENDLSKSIGNYDKKSSEKLLTHSLQLIKEQKVQTYSDLKQKLIIEHKNDAYIVQLMINSLYNLFENQGIENINKTDISLVKHDMGHLPAKQTNDTEIHLNKEATSLTATSMTKETVRSCLTCGRSKSKTTLPITTTSGSGLLDERRRLQLNTHRNELGNILRDHIQSSQPSIRKFPDHPKEVEKILRKSLTLANQPQINSYEQIRNDLKTEYKQTYYLVDPIVDILRDTFNHCDITQMNEKTNLDILDSNINQTAHLYNNNQMNLLTTEESNAFKSNQLSWLQEYLINNETKEKKLTKKQIKELNKILHRNLEIFNNNYNSTWDDVLLQLKREYPKANDLCQRSVDLLKQAQKDGLFYLQQAPTTEKRRASSLITDRARQNLKTNKNKIFLSLKNLLINYNKPLLDNDQQQLDNYLNKTLNYLEEQKAGQFKTYNDLKEQLKKDFSKTNSEKLIEQIVDVIEQAHATNQFDDIDKPEVQTLMKDRLDGKPLVIKEMYVSLPPRIGAYGDESLRYASTSINGDRTTASHRVARGLSWREANERARILFYRGKHPAIHYDEQAAAFDVRMLLETASGGTQEIPVTDSDVHELLNSCGVQWDGVNIISLVDHSEDVVRAAEQAALKVIRERGLVDLRTPPPATTITTTTISTKTEETINSPSISS